MSDAKPVEAAPPALVWTYSALSASLAAGYGVLFTIVSDYREDYGISETEIGWIIGAGFIVSFLAQLVLGPLGDRGFARRLVIVGILGNAVGLLVMGVGTSFEVLMFGRVLSGLALGFSFPAIKRIVVVGSGRDLGRNLGRLLSADVFGFALGPAVSAVLAGPFGLLAPFALIAFVSVVILVVSLTMPVAEGGAASDSRLALDLLKVRPFASAVFLGAGAYLMIGCFDALWDVVHSDLRTADWMANLGIILFAIPLIVLGPTAGRLAQRLGPLPVATAGLLVASIFMGSYGVLPTGQAIFAVVLVHAVTDGLTFAASGVAVGMAVPEERQAGAQGVLGAAQALSAGLMAVVSGTLYEEYGRLVAYAAGAAGIVTFVVVAGALAGGSFFQLKEPLASTSP